MRKEPERTCLGCRAVRPVSEMFCFVAPDGQVRLARRGPRQRRIDDVPSPRGRGAWAHSDCLPAALKAMPRAFRRQIEVPDLETLLAQMHVASGRSISAQGDTR